MSPHIKTMRILKKIEKEDIGTIKKVASLSE